MLFQFFIPICQLEQFWDLSPLVPIHLSAIFTEPNRLSNLRKFSGLGIQNCPLEDTNTPVFQDRKEIYM